MRFGQNRSVQVRLEARQHVCQLDLPLLQEEKEIPARFHGLRRYFSALVTATHMLEAQFSQIVLFCFQHWKNRCRESLPPQRRLEEQGMGLHDACTCTSLQASHSASDVGGFQCVPCAGLSMGNSFGGLRRDTKMKVGNLRLATLAI